MLTKGHPGTSNFTLLFFPSFPCLLFIFSSPNKLENQVFAEDETQKVVQKKKID